MKSFHIIPFILGLSLLASCAPTREQFDAVATVIQGSSKARQDAVQQCISKWDARGTRSAAIIIDSSEKDAPRLICSRVYAAMASGRLTYADTVDLSQKKFTPKLIKILQGR